VAGDNGVKPVIWIFEFGTAHLAYQLKQAARDKHPSPLAPRYQDRGQARASADVVQNPYRLTGQQVTRSDRNRQLSDMWFSTVLRSHETLKFYL